MDVPLVFLEILKNERRFQEVANAFLLGLRQADAENRN